MRILVDLDGVAADLHGKWLAAYNAWWQDELTRADLVRTYHVHENVAERCAERVYDIILEPGFFDDLVPLPGAVESIEELRESHEVLVCTAAAGPDSARAKLEWCARHLDMDRKHVILTHRKELVACDVFVDDSPMNLIAMRDAQPGCHIIAMGYPYNRDLARAGVLDWWASDYTDPEGAWDTIRANIAGVQMALEAKREAGR